MWLWLNSSYGDGDEKDSVQGSKQTTVVTLHLEQYKSQDLRLSLGFYSYTVSHVQLATGNTRSHVAC